MSSPMQGGRDETAGVRVDIGHVTRAPALTDERSSYGKILDDQYDDDDDVIAVIIITAIVDVVRWS